MMRWLLLVLLLVLPTSAAAHKPSDALLQIEQSGATLRLQWEVALRDLEIEPGLDDGDGVLHLRELQAHEAALFALLARHVRLSAAPAGAPCTTQADTLDTSEHSDGTYARLTAILTCPEAGALTLDYDYLFEADPQHRLIARVGAHTTVLGNGNRRAELPLAHQAPSANLFRAGVQHILEGIDHLLFLLALLLPAVLTGRDREPARSFRPVFGEVVRVVTAFTVAHSLTLSLAVLGVATLPARLVEPAIAASVVVAAALNLLPAKSSHARWPVAYALGLLHGYGLSSTLDDIGLHGRALLVPLFTFNLGVEAGQLTVVLVTLPLLYAARRWRFYSGAILRGSSLLIALIASVWLVERAFEVNLIG